MTRVLLGNSAPMMQVMKARIDEQTALPVIEQVSEPAKHIEQSVTGVDMANGFDDPEFVERTLSTDNDRMLVMIARQLDADHQIYAVGIQQLEQLWSLHSAAGSPAYVSCPDDPEFEAAIAAHFTCPQGEPTALLLNQGRDALHAQHASLSQPAGYTFMSLSANNAAEVASNTSIPGEITTAGGGLIRGSATMAHTAGTNTTTGTRTFTANAADVTAGLPVVAAKIGMHNASSGAGNAGYEKLLNATATYNALGDSATVTWTDTIG